MKDKQSEAIRLKKLYYYRKEEGKCITCGGISIKYVRCLECRKRIQKRRLNAKIPKIRQVKEYQQNSTV